MTAKNAAVFVAAFATVLMAGGAGYVVLQTYTPPPSAAPPVVPEVRQFHLHLHATEAGETTVHHWMPPVVVVHVGDTVILRVTNADPETAHGFGLAAFDISLPELAPGQTRTVRFRATRPGIFPFGCTMVGCAADHADQTGQLVVLAGR
jgi:heme/copper-type cytochrome/quinol oxidase subunit 2